jgi:hypothetical protein
MNEDDGYVPEKAPPWFWDLLQKIVDRWDADA